jgi:hypothetical protein
MAGRWELTDEQWELVDPLLRPARCPWHDTRAVLYGVPWILEPIGYRRIHRSTQRKSEALYLDRESQRHFGKGYAPQTVLNKRLSV